MLQQHIRISSFHPSIGIGLIHGADASPSLWRFQIDHLSALHTKRESLSFLPFEVSVTKKSRKPVILPYYQNAKQLMGQFPVTSLEHIAKCLSRSTGRIAPPRCPSQEEGLTQLKFANGGFYRCWTLLRQS